MEGVLLCIIFLDLNHGLSPNINFVKRLKRWEVFYYEST